MVTILWKYHQSCANIENRRSQEMFNILRKAGRGIKKFMSEKINTCKEILSSAQNRLVIGLVMIGTGVGFVVSAYIKAPAE